MGTLSRLDRILSLCAKLPSSLTPDVHEKLLSMSEPTTQRIVWFVDDWTVETATTLRELSVLTLIARGLLQEAASLLQQTFDPRHRGEIVAVCEQAKRLPPQVLADVEKEIEELDLSGYLGLHLAFKLHGFLDAVRKRPGDTKFFEGDFTCVDESVSRIDLDRWLQDHEIHDAQGLKELVEDVTETKFGAAAM